MSPLATQQGTLQKNKGKLLGKWPHPEKGDAYGKTASEMLRAWAALR